MIVKLASRRSHRAVSDYITHDKPTKGNRRPSTSARVAWVAVRNLPTDDPDLACRMMAATCSIADHLKHAAGVSARGRKLRLPVEHIVLSWKARERVRREEMEGAAEELLEELGLVDHECVMAAHTDTANPHVHVSVNRVSPIDGRAARTGTPAVRKAQSWAERYERRRGKIQCPKRVQNRLRRGAPGRLAPLRGEPPRRRRADGSPVRPRAGETAVWAEHYEDWRNIRGDSENARKARSEISKNLTAARSADPGPADAWERTPEPPSDRDIARFEREEADDEEILQRIEAAARLAAMQPAQLLMTIDADDLEKRRKRSRQRAEIKAMEAKGGRLLAGELGDPPPGRAAVGTATPAPNESPPATGAETAEERWERVITAAEKAAASAEVQSKLRLPVHGPTEVTSGAYFAEQMAVDEALSTARTPEERGRAFDAGLRWTEAILGDQVRDPAWRRAKGLPPLAPAPAPGGEPEPEPEFEEFDPDATVPAFMSRVLAEREAFEAERRERAAAAKRRAEATEDDESAAVAIEQTPNEKAGELPAAVMLEAAAREFDAKLGAAGEPNDDIVIERPSDPRGDKLVRAEDRDVAESLKQLVAAAADVPGRKRD